MAFNYPLDLDKTSAVYYAMSLISLCKVVFVSKVKKVSFETCCQDKRIFSKRSFLFFSCNVFKVFSYFCNFS